MPETTTVLLYNSLDAVAEKYATITYIQLGLEGILLFSLQHLLIHFILKLCYSKYS